MLFFAVALYVAACSGVFATQTAQAAQTGQTTPEQTMRTVTLSDRAAAQRAFDQLMENTQKGLRAPNAVVNSKFVAIDPVYFAPMLPPPAFNGGRSAGTITTTIEALDAEQIEQIDKTDSTTITGITNAMRIWFELPDGRLVDPSVYRFSPREVFLVHIEAAVPVYVTLFQNFPDGRDTVQVYPVERFPSSFRILDAGISTKLPVLFAMDDNYDAEFMSVVVARADWEEIAADVPDSAATAVLLAQAATPEEYAAVYRGIARGRADISNPHVMTKFAAVIEIDDICGVCGAWGTCVCLPPPPICERCDVPGCKGDCPLPPPPVRCERCDAPGCEGDCPLPPPPPICERCDATGCEGDCPPPPCCPVCREPCCWDGTTLPGPGAIDKVALYMFSQTGVGRIQITLQKVEPTRP